ncbi:tyrosine-type recombinase/integrase [Nonomuraea typhae]|uniref:tyrosine-type recombinase/integrase n=1 Tax=Nonomuraea typhae TaxID=2603600 RepID=UPI0015E23E53|nr:tyrosine-type recombinase/integrase [Nonomuraea typhae]
MATATLRRGMGSVLRPAFCKHGEKSRCKCPRVARWRDIEGKQRELTFSTHTEALDHLCAQYELKRKIRQGMRPKGAAPLLSMFASSWLEQRSSLSASTIRKYDSALTNHVLPYLGQMSVAEVDFDGVNQFIQELKKSGAEPGLIQTCVVNLLGPIFELAIRLKWRDDNPARGHELAKVKVGKRILPRVDEVGALADAIGPRYRLAIWLMAGCGLRQGEALGARAGLLRGTDTIYIDEQWLDHGAGYGPLKHKDVGEGRIIPLPRDVLREYQEHVARYGIADGQPLFPSPVKAGQPVSHSAFSAAFARARRKVGLRPEIKQHNLRHFFATHAIENGADITHVSKWLGHDSIETTYRIYADLLRQSFTRGAAAMDVALAAA